MFPLELSGSRRFGSVEPLQTHEKLVLYKEAVQTASFSSFFSLKVADFKDVPSKPQPDKQAAIKHLCDILVDPKQRNVSCAMLFKPSLINYTRKNNFQYYYKCMQGVYVIVTLPRIT